MGDGPHLPTHAYAQTDTLDTAYRNIATPPHVTRTGHPTIHTTRSRVEGDSQPASCLLVLCLVLGCSVLHYTTLHYTTLHYTTPRRALLRPAGTWRLTPSPAGDHRQPRLVSFLKHPDTAWESLVHPRVVQESHNPAGYPRQGGSQFGKARHYSCPRTLPSRPRPCQEAKKELLWYGVTDSRLVLRPSFAQLPIRASSEPAVHQAHLVEGLGALLGCTRRRLTRMAKLSRSHPSCTSPRPASENSGNKTPRNIST